MDADASQVRLSSVPWWSPISWRSWVRELRKGGPRAKAPVPLTVQRSEQKAAVRAYVRKRPAAAVLQQPMHKRRRTVFTRDRPKSLISQGVRASVYAAKRPAAKQ